MKNQIVETLLLTIISVLVAQYRGKFHAILANVADKLNDKIEGTATEIDDEAKAELIRALKEAFIPQLEVEGVDGPVDQASDA